MIFIVYGKQEDNIPAAAIAYWALQIVNEPISVVSKPMNQCLDIKYDLDDTFYFIGYSFTSETKEFLVRLLTEGVKVIWLDTHRTSFEVHADIVNISNHLTAHLDASVSLTKLIWEYFHLKKESLAVSLLDKWEQYDMTNDVVRYFHLALVVQDEYQNPMSYFWKEIFEKDEKVNEIIEIGKFISVSQKRNEIRSLRNISIYEMENGSEYAILNSTGDRYIFDVAYKLFDACILYNYNGIEWNYQIFSRHKNLAGNYALIHGGPKNYKSWASNFRKSNEDHEIYWDYLNSHRVSSLYDHPAYQKFIETLDEP